MLNNIYYSKDEVFGKNQKDIIIHMCTTLGKPSRRCISDIYIKLIDTYTKKKRENKKGGSGDFIFMGKKNTLRRAVWSSLAPILHPSRPICD
jgi:hypothetical protein